MTTRFVTLLALCALSGAPAGAQHAYPAKGQSAQQQKTDEAACHTWAVQQSGFDPANPPAAAAPATTPTGTTPGAGARGAARGAVVAEVVGGDAGKGAAVGAAASRSRSRQANAAAAQQTGGTQQQQASYANARGACMQGKGYTVK